MTTGIFCILVIVACGILASYQAWEAEQRVRWAAIQVAKERMMSASQKRIVKGCLELLGAEDLDAGVEKLRDLLDMERLVRMHWESLPPGLREELGSEDP